MVYTDRGFWKDRCLRSQAALVTRARRVVTEHVEWVLAASSFNVEIVALESAVSWLCTHNDMVDSPVVYFLINNKGVIQSFLKMHICSSQTTATHINLLLHDLFQRRPDLRIHVSYCPSHSGIPFNVQVDHLVSSHDDPSSLPRGMLHQHFLEDHLKSANAQWQALSRLESYRSRHWLLIRHKK